MSLHALGMFFSIKFLPLVYAIVGFGALIAIHECGHFIFCKLFGIHTPTFSIGFGPEIFHKKIGNTNFRLAAIPIGGYVEIAGLAEVGQGSQEHATVTGQTSFEDKPYWQKLCVLAGGIIFNLLFAYMVFCLLFMVGTAPNKGIVVAEIVPNSAAQRGKLTPKDSVIKINDQALLDQAGNVLENAHDILLQTIRSNPEQAITLTVVRGTETVSLPVTLGSRMEADKKVGIIGAGFMRPRLPFFQAIAKGITETNQWIYRIVAGIKQLFTQRSLEGTGGPVMIMSLSFSSAQQGILPLLVFLALISINLALVNLLPIGALDGGQILFTTIEAIIRRKVPEVLRNGINVASWLLIIGLTLFLTYRDVALLFGDKLSALYKKILGLVCK